MLTSAIFKVVLSCEWVCTSVLSLLFLKKEVGCNWNTSHGKDPCWPRLSLSVFTELALKMRIRVSGNCLGTYVCINIGCLDYRGIVVRDPTGVEIFLFSRLPIWFWGPPSLLSRGIGDLPVGLKRPGSQVDHIPPSSAEAKIMWSCTSNCSWRRNGEIQNHTGGIWKLCVSQQRNFWFVHCGINWDKWIEVVCMKLDDKFASLFTFTEENGII